MYIYRWFVLDTKNYFGWWQTLWYIISR